MADIFIEGFDKYGALNSDSASVTTLLPAGDWTQTGSNTTFAIVAGLSATGSALSITYGPLSVAALSKTLAANYTRLIGGARFNANLSSANAGIGFASNGTQACTITINTTGAISLRTGANTGTALATSSTTVAANATHYLEWDITFGASSAYQVWLDAVSVFSGTGNTANGVSNVNQFNFQGQDQAISWDDVYLFDSTTATNNAVLNTNPRIETQFPTADSAVQFTFGAAILGTAEQAFAGTGNPGANELVLRTYTPAVAGVLNSVACLPQTSAGAAKFTGVLYADSSGVPGALLATGAEVVGCISGNTLVSAFSPGQTLTASTAYWLGFINDTAITLALTDNNNTGRTKSNTYTSGPPSPAGTTTSGQPSWVVYGNLSGVAVDYYEVSVNPPPGDISYVYASSSGYEDLYAFPALSSTPNNIYTVCVKGNIKKSDTGTRTVSLQCKSSSSDSAGSNSGQTPATTYGWLDSFFDTDPNTGVAWTVTGLNAATSGVKIAS
jgi:hypothetical protein